jgi:hypothetical protein
MKLFRWVGDRVINWLVREDEIAGSPFCDFNRLSFEIRPCDVLLVEGRSHVSDVIKTITQSIWTHAALYIGRLYDITDTALREQIARHYSGDPNEQLMIEALLGQGTIVCPLAKYKHENLRICRPRGLASHDAQKVIAFAARHVGSDYNVRQLLDLARFMYPYTILPRRWRSSLFEHHAGASTQTVCSTMIAEAFAAVKFPVLPVIQQDHDGRLRLYKRNTRLYTPRDFDYSPYFEIIKYPLLGIDDISLYQRLPWDEHGRICNSQDDCYTPAPAEPATAGDAVNEDRHRKPSATGA